MSICSCSLALCHHAVDDIRAKMRIATNFRLVAVAPEGRSRGIIDTTKDGFGFVEHADGPERLFFHYKELLQADYRELRRGTEVEFNIGGCYPV
jgi:cold shock CspA family protein